jgi:hypothetical protein
MNVCLEGKGGSWPSRARRIEYSFSATEHQGRETGKLFSFERANSFIDQEFGTSEPDSEAGSIPSHTELDITV